MEATHDCLCWHVRDLSSMDKFLFRTAILLPVVGAVNFLIQSNALMITVSVATRTNKH